MLTKQQALELVSRKFQQMTTPDDPFVVVEEETIEKPYGWIFFYNSKKYIESGQIRFALAGNGPVIVNKRTETVEFCGTNRSVQELIEDYEKKLTD